VADNYCEFSELIGELSSDEVSWFVEQLSLDPGTNTIPGLARCEELDADESDATYLEFQYDLVRGDAQSGKPGGSLHLYATERGSVSQVVHIVQKFLRRWRPTCYFVLRYSARCGRPRVGEFGGGAVFVTAGEADWMTVNEWVQQRVESAKLAAYDNLRSV